MILAANFGSFVDILSHPDPSLDPEQVALIVDRLIQAHPPNFNSAAKSELEFKLTSRYTQAPDPDQPPSEVLAALDLMRLLADKPQNVLVLYIHRIGADFTKNQDICVSYLQSRPASVQLTEEQVSMSLTYTTISQTPVHDPSVFVAAVRRVVPATFRWPHVVSYFDQRGARISARQFLRLYNALLPVAQDESKGFDITSLWGGEWENPETHLSFICAYASLLPGQLDATTIPGIKHTFSLEKYRDSPPAVQEEARKALRHPLSSAVVLNSIFHVALHSVHASQSTEARRLFQKVVVPNLDIFMVSACSMPKPWPSMAVDTLTSLFDNFLYKISQNYDFVMHSLWKDDKQWVIDRLIDVHAIKPIDLPIIFDHAVKQGWMKDLVILPNGFGYDIAALAHAEGYLNLTDWAHHHQDRQEELSKTLLTFLSIKAGMELQTQRPPEGGSSVKTTTSLQVRTVYGLLSVLQEINPRAPFHELILVQRQCITVYPRLINYGEGFDDIIDANGKDGNVLPAAANSKMEEHYKQMYNNEIPVRTVVDTLERYKRSQDPLEQDIFACMIHGLFDEYSHYIDYPLEALATTAVLFGAIISRKLISDLPLHIGLGMILEAVKEHPPEHPMFKFGLQALIQLFPRFPEWPGFCKQLLAIPGLHDTEAWKKSEEVVREIDEEARVQVRHGRDAGGLANGDQADDGVSAEKKASHFNSINLDHQASDMVFEEPNEQVRGQILFCLNNLTESTLSTRYDELSDLLDARHHQWFARCLVEERAKMQPNYHTVYVELVEHFNSLSLWDQVLRETFISVARMLNSEVTLRNATERTHLKNLGGWLGLITLARNKPIKHRNIAFKQLLIEAHDTKRLVIVIPFVCKVLVQGAKSTIFRPPNPWLMDIVKLLIELYHNAELKLNLKFEIEVLCKDLNLDHKTIDPSQEIVNRVLLEDAMVQQPGMDGVAGVLEGYDGMLGMNGLGGAVGGGSLSHGQMIASIPDLTNMITVPPTNDMVISSQRLHDLVQNALKRALQDIIQPVVERSITIAAISTVQMIHKDFATEPNEERLRTSAVSMVKATAGSLALVTSKEPLRSNFTNYMRTLAGDLPQQGLPEGTVIMCVNSNLDLACSIIEKQAEERAIPEIERLLSRELEARRRHMSQHPNDPYMDPDLNRWAWTIPTPYKLSPNVSGLNPEQMAIYENFARQPRVGATQAGLSHATSASEATRSLANEVLGDGFGIVPPLPAPAADGSLSNTHLSSHVQNYPQVANTGVANSRAHQQYQFELGAVTNRVHKLFTELHRAATEAQERHFGDLPRSHPVLDVVDALVQQLIKTQQSSDDVPNYAAEQLCNILFSHEGNQLLVETLVHVMEQSRKISPTFNSRVVSAFQQQSGNHFLNINLIMALLPTDLLEWQRIDSALAKMLHQRKETAMDFLEQMLQVTLLPERPIALFADFIASLAAAWQWIQEDSNLTIGRRLVELLKSSGVSAPTHPVEIRDQYEYILDEWGCICFSPNAAPSSQIGFLKQLRHSGLIKDSDDYFWFVRHAIELCVLRSEMSVGRTARYARVDALAKLVVGFARINCDSRHDAPAGFDEFVSIVMSTLMLTVMTVHAHYISMGDDFRQPIYTRLISSIWHETCGIYDLLPTEILGHLLLGYADTLNRLNPCTLPGFVYGWMYLLQHRTFIPYLLDLPEKKGWHAYATLLSHILEYLAPHLRQLQVHEAVKDLYRGILKLIIVLHHDYPEFMTATGQRLAALVPPHCAQLLNCILFSLSAVLDKSEEQTEVMSCPEGQAEWDRLDLLQATGLKDVTDAVMHNGVTEDAVANVALAIKQDKGQFFGFGNVPIKANLTLIDAITRYVGCSETEQARSTDSVLGTGGSPGASMISLLVHELPPEPRYYLLFSVMERLRAPNDPQTHYFSRIVLDLFSNDPMDHEELEIREQIARIMLERLLGYWPQPWGVVATFTELVKNEKYLFFDMPFIKSSQEVSPCSHVSQLLFSLLGGRL